MDLQGKIAKTIQQKEKLDTWADLLGVERSPIIFQGYLDETQKEQLTEFLATPFQQLVSRFQTQSFVRFIISVLNPELKSSALNDDLDKDVEGVVFRFGEPNSENETVLAKMVDPLFTDLAKTKYQEKRDKKPSDFLGITLLDVMNFILQQGVDSFEVEGEGEDERYISFISDVFAKFLEENAEKYRGADFEEPEYLKKPEFRLNRDLVRDRRVAKFVEEDEAFESLYKLLLNSFRKLKTRASGIVTSGTLAQLNLLIQEIKDHIERPEKEVNESEFVSFLDFQKDSKPNVKYVLEESEDTEKNENPLLSFDDFISKLESIDQQSSDEEEPLVEKEEELSNTERGKGGFGSTQGVVAPEIIIKP